MSRRRTRWRPRYGNALRRSSMDQSPISPATKGTFYKIFSKAPSAQQTCLRNDSVQAAIGCSRREIDVPSTTSADTNDIPSGRAGTSDKYELPLPDVLINESSAVHT